MCLWRVTDLAHRHRACCGPPPAEWLALAGGELLADSLYVRVLSAAPELSAALWPELIEPLPFKVQLGVVADLLTGDTGDALGSALLSSLVLTAPVGEGDHHRAWTVARGRGRRYHRFVWDLLQATRDQLRSCAKAAAHAHAHERDATDGVDTDVTDGYITSLLCLLVNLFVRGRDKKASVLTEGVVSDLAFLPRVSALLPLLMCRDQTTALRDHFERLDAAIAEWQARHGESFADVVAPPGKKQIAQRIDELLGLRKRRGAHEEHDDSEATVRGHLGAADGLQQLLHKAERGSTAALRQLVTDTDAAHSFGIARWLEAVVRARWLVPLVQIGELVYPLLTALVRLHVELCCPSAPEADEMGADELQQQIRRLYLDYFRELPQAQQATARAFCYFNSVRRSPQDVAPLRNADDEQSLLDAQSTVQSATTPADAGRYLFNDPALVAEAERQLTVKLNRLVPEHLDDKNYLSSVYEVSLVIPLRFVERIVGEGVANAKQAAVLCSLLHNTGLVARYRSHDSEDGMSLVGQVVDRYVGDIKTWRAGPEAERDFIAMLVLLLEPRAPVGDESGGRGRAGHDEGDASLDQRVRASLAQARTAIYDGTELLAWSLVPRVQQMAGDLRYGAPCTPELQDHLALLLDLVAAVLGGSDDYGGPERAYYDHTQCGLAPPEERYLARRLWVLEAYPWELLLALCQLLRQRPRFRAAVVARLVHVTERVAAFLALCLIARVRHPSLPGWRPGAQAVSGGGSSMGDFLSEIRDLEVDVLLRLRPLFAAAQPYQREGGSSPLYLPASWVDDSDGLPDWPMAPQSGEYTEEELLESYVRCLCYCRVSDRHCRLFLHWFSVEQAAEEYHHHHDDDGALLAYQLLAFAVVLSYSTAEEYYRLAHVLLPRMIEADLLRFQLPTALPLPLAATAVERAELGVLRGQVCALHLLLRMTVSLVLPRGGELAALYAAAAIDLPPELATTEGRRQVLHALDTHRDHLQWPTNFARVVHGAVVLWEQKTKETKEEVEQERQDWVAVGHAVLLGHALLVSVKLLCALQACTGPEGDQRQVGILALDIAHRLNTALASPPPPPAAATAEASRALLMQLVRHSAALVLAGGRSHPDSENLLLQLKALMPDADHPPPTNHHHRAFEGEVLKN